MSLDARCRKYSALFGDWRVEKRLGSGSGGKSSVYLLSRDLGWREECALKVISLIEERGNYDALPDYRQREYDLAASTAKENATREVLLMNQLRGKTNIVDYLNHRFVNWKDESGFGMDLLIRMEKLTDLRSQIAAGHRFREEEVRRLGVDICRALILCHGKQIIHRDIKPENIFFNADGDFKLGDFGIARIMSASADSRASTSIGTAAYSAPEQTQGRYDERVDLYSLGLVMYELLNGNRLPFADSSYVTEQQIRLRISGAPIPAPKKQSARNPYGTLPSDAEPGSPLSAVIMKACAFRAQDRFSSAEEMLRALENPRFVPLPPEPPHGPIRETPQPPVHEMPRPPISGQSGQKKRLLLWLPAAVAAVLLIFLLGALLQRHTHTWEKATCTSPRTCSGCGQTSGEALGHQWLDGDCVTPRICSVCGHSEGTAPGHSWIEANCLAPRTCSRCGLTQGAALGHSWTGATCTSPEHCEDCGLTTGSALGHSWQNATFLEPMKCTRCGDTSGDPVPINSVSVENEIEWIRNVYYDVMDRADRDQLRKVMLDNHATAYYDSYGELVRLDVPYGLDGLGSESAHYSRIYIYSNERLIFAFIAGQDSHRLYFYQELLIRWLYRPNQHSTIGAVTYDLNFSDEYLYWEALALAEGRSYLD